MKIVFMGTPQFAVPILEQINKKHDVVLVVTQPDVWNVKKKRMEYSPVKEYVINNNLPLFQPEVIRKDYKPITDIEVDLIVTAAYGQFIGEEVLNHPKYKSINVHGSLLPKYRGGAPIQRAIINGEKVTGITIQYMAEKMDAGKMIMKREIPILDSDNQDSLFNKLSILGSEVINEVIDRIQSGLIEAEEQDESLVSFAYNLSKEDELIDFNKSAREVFNQIRGLNSNPGGYFVIDEMNVKVYDSRESEKKSNLLPGVIVDIGKDYFAVSCKDNEVIDILEIKLPSKNKMKVRDFLNGQGKKILVKGKKIN